MQPEVSLPHSQKPAIWFCSEPSLPRPCPRHTSWISILILSSHLCLGLPSGLYPSGLHTKTLSAPLLSPKSATGPVILFLFWSPEKCLVNYPLSCYLVPIRSKFFLSTISSNTLSPRSFLNVRDQVSHPYKTTGKITVLYLPAPHIALMLWHLINCSWIHTYMYTCIKL